jgi:hypothetical protein
LPRTRALVCDSVKTPLNAGYEHGKPNVHW